MGWSDKTPPSPPLSQPSPEATAGTARGALTQSARRPLWFAVSSLLVGAIALSGIFGLARTALADPHAIFYTAIGQQQLFFNVLAALDQADYVETQYDREKLLSRREAAGKLRPFTPQEQAIVDQTRVGPQNISPSEPGVSALLSRLITLEGHDLYTDFLIRMLGAEFQRRNATSELGEVLCAFSLGWRGCEPLPITSLSPREFERVTKERRRAVVIRPQQYAAEPFTRGVLGALASGVDGALRDKIKNDPEKNKLPYAYSPDIHQWRKDIASRSDGSLHWQLLETMLASEARSYIPGLFDYPYRNFTFDASGSLKVSNYPDGRPADLKRMASALASADDAPLAVSYIAQAAHQRVAAQLDMTQSAGSRADGQLDFERNVDNSGIGELTSLVEVPAAVRVGEVGDLSNVLAQLDTSQEFSTLSGIDEPGGVQLVERGQVSGIQTTARETAAAEPRGEVAGVLSDLFRLISNYYFDAPRAATPAGANIVAGHLEARAAHVLDAITNREFSINRGKQAPTCTVCGFFDILGFFLGGG